MVFLKRPAFALLFCAVLASGSATAQRRGEYALRAAATLDSLYACYSVPGTKLLRENYPDDASYKATYLAGESAGNPFSYLWPFSGTLSAVVALVETVGWEAYGPLLDTVVLPGLREYADDRRRPFAYASYIASAPVSDRFYDDNIWLGIDFTDLYAATRQQRFLDEAERIWLFIASGTDDRLGGGIYWCEQKKESKNTCSNAPGAVFALKLYLATGREHYLEQGRALYEWTRRKLLDSSDNLYFDHISLKGPLNKTKYSYNSGQMIQAGALLYRITGRKRYLSEAQATAAACLTHFFRPVRKPGGGSVRILRRDKIWFDAVMLRGFIELYREDGRDVGLNAFRETLDHAWSHARDTRGLLADWSGRGREGRKWLLSQAALAEMLARMASVAE
ncbi:MULTISPECIES: glycoside hydrolase family 76 protein [unclassified Alistipes]|uniref:glycoside hydrolase family 76 protein n=1 Tax=unclassified Alistipes TaxID=2608932 RepID=UPI0036F2465B